MAAGSLRAQPSFVGPAPVPAVLRDESLRRAAYQARIDEVLTWRASLVKPGDPATFGLSEIGAKMFSAAKADGVEMPNAVEVGLCDKVCTREDILAAYGQKK